MQNVSMDQLISLCKRRGFIFPGSEIYGGLANAWDFGPLGVALKNNIKRLWWQTIVEERDDVYGLDAALLMNRKVWQASGHESTFSDPLVECKSCHARLREDQLSKDKTCPSCGKKEFTEAKQFNLMLKTFLGPAEEEANLVYFRPETAQAIFVDFKQIIDAYAPKLPFGIAQKHFATKLLQGILFFARVSLNRWNWNILYGQLMIGTYILSNGF
jgi:glycyl-tRNA synthetase